MSQDFVNFVFFKFCLLNTSRIYQNAAKKKGFASSDKLHSTLSENSTTQISRNSNTSSAFFAGAANPFFLLAWPTQHVL